MKNVIRVLLLALLLSCLALPMAASAQTGEDIAFSVTVGEKTVDYAAEGAEEALVSYLGAMEQGATVTLHSDLTLPPLTVAGARIADKAAAESATYALDLGGHTLTFSGSGVALRVLAPNFYLYSSAAGGSIRAESHTLFATGEDDYKWIGGRAFAAGTAEYGQNADAARIAPRGSLSLGEADSTALRYGENLTAFCATVNAELHGGGAEILGGCFVQSQAASAPYFLLLSDLSEQTAQMRRVENAHFVLMHGESAALYYRSGLPVTFKNCFFASLDPSLSPLFLDDGALFASDIFFEGCAFFDILPDRFIGDREIDYGGSLFGFSSAAPSADLDERESVAYLTPSESTEAVACLGREFDLNYSLTCAPYESVTVSYADGTRTTLSVGDAFPSYLPALTAEKDGKLYKRVGEGWTYTLLGDTLEGGTVPAAAAGKTVIATGYTYERVYYTSLEQTASGTVTVYHLRNDLDIYLSEANLGDRGDGTNEGASSYRVLRLETTAKVVITLYDDFELSVFKPSWYDASNRIGGRNVYLDLNGHTVEVGQKEYVHLQGMKLHIYSSVPGAHWYHTGAKQMFRPDNDAALYLGNNASNGKYADNITFHGRSVLYSVYGNGAYIRGGIYRQSAKNAVFVEISRRVLEISNAKFYLYEGSTALFGDTDTVRDYRDIAKGTKSITGCTFSSPRSAYILYSEGTAAPTYEGCTLDGILTETTEGSVTVAYPDGEEQVFLLWDEITLRKPPLLTADKDGGPLVLSEVRWILTDGDGKALTFRDVSPDMLGKRYTATAAHTYDKVLFSVEDEEGTAYYTDENTVAFDFMTALSSLGKETRIVLYSDITTPAIRISHRYGMSAAALIAARCELDLCGHTLTFSGAGEVAMEVRIRLLSLYSSRPGGRILAPGKTLVRTAEKDYATSEGSVKVCASAVLGEGGSSDSLTAVCRSINEGSTKGTLSVLGGSFVQQSAGASCPMLVGSADVFVDRVYDATLVLDGRSVPLSFGGGSFAAFSRTRIFSRGGAPVLLAKTDAAALYGRLSFDQCEFYDTVPALTLGSLALSFADCTFGFSADAPTADLDAAAGEAYFKAIPCRTVTVLDEHYTLFCEVEVKSGSGCTVTYPGGASYFYALGTQIRPFTEGDTYQGADGHLYKRGTGWQFLLDGQALSSLTVTEAMVGKTVAAEGYDRVYFTVEANGGVTYHTDASTAASALSSYLTAMDYGARVTLHSDLSIAPLTLLGKRTSDANAVKNATYALDINGYTLTFTASSAKAAMIFKTAYFYLYSSRPGGRILAESHSFFYSDNDDYKWESGTAVLPGSTAYTASSESVIAPFATVYIGESPDGTRDGGDYLTVVCARVNYEMYGTGAYLHGGTFVQSESSTASYFLLASRTGSAGAHIRAVENTTFIVRGSGTEPIYYRSGSALTFKSCRFICTSGTPIAVLTLTEGVNLPSKPTFDGCEFYDVLPLCFYRSIPISYPGCAFGFSGAAPAEDLHEAAEQTAFLAKTEPRQISANGAAYTLDRELIVSDAGFVSVFYPDGRREIYFVGEEITPFTTEATFTSGGTLYADLGSGWQYLLDGTALSSLTVTADMAGKTVEAAGYAKVYYYLDVDGTVTYHTDGATYASSMKAYLGAMDQGVRIVLCEDLTLAPLTLFGKRIEDKTLAEEASYFLDLNGRTLTFSGSGRAMTFKTAYFYLYSSVPGGRIVAESHTLFYTDNDDYKWVNGAAVTSSSTAYTDSALAPIKPSAKLILGEADLTTACYGDNLTAVCAQVNTAMYGTGALFRGGRYEQSESGNATAFLYLSRVPVPEGYTVRLMENATFIAGDSSEAFCISNLGALLEIRNCRFISTEGPLPFMSGASTAFPALRFEGSAFYDITASGLYGGKKATYTDCAFGFSGAACAQDGLFVAHAPNAVTVEGYTLDCVCVSSLSEVLTVSWAGYREEYWLPGTRPVLREGLPDFIFKDESGRAVARIGAVIRDGSLFTVTADMCGKTRTVDAVYRSELAVAFTYTAADGTVYYKTMTEGMTPAEVGALFHSTFDECDGAYTVVLHTDILLTKGVGWGPIGVVDTNVPEYKSLQNGSVTLDLNGFTLTVDAAVEGINASNSNSASYPKAGHGAFVFEINTGNTFTLTSSRPGARVVNLSEGAFIVVGEQAATTVYIDGENITFESVGTVLYSFECANTAVLRVKGGRFIHSGSVAPISWVGEASIEGAEIHLTGAAKSVFGAHYWKRNVSFSVTDTLIYASSADTALFAFYTSKMAVAEPVVNGNTYAITLTDCAVIGMSLPASIDNFGTPVYDGVALTDPEVLLALLGGSAPEGRGLALLEREVDGVIYRMYAYLAPEKIGTVDWGFGLPTELWRLGEIATRENATVGSFAYAFDPTPVSAASVSGSGRVIGVRPGMLRMSLSLESRLGVKIFVSEALGATAVELAGEAYSLADMKAEGGYFGFLFSLAPNLAHESVSLKVTVGGYEHTVPVSVEAYASALLSADAYASAHDLTYAMIEYVRAQTGAAFASCRAPFGYDRAEPAPRPHQNGELSLLESITLRPDGTVSIALLGVDGTRVQVVFASGRSESRVIEDGVCIIEGIYINEFFGEFSIRASRGLKVEKYAYDLENYLYYLSDEALILRVKSLYNYTYHAHLYVDTLTGVLKDENADHICDLCSVTRSPHTDEGGDGLCDICKSTLPWSEGLVLEEIEGGFAVTGIGSCEDTDIRVPETYLGKRVIAVAEGAFDGCENIRTVRLPESVKRVENGAFANCSLLSTLYIGKYLTYIGENATAGCVSLASVYFEGKPAALRAITLGAGNEAFTEAALYAYSESQPAAIGRFWHYGADGNAIAHCADLDGDHICEDCGKSASVCTDADLDHLCDLCGERASEHAGGTDHICDICGETFGTCADADKNHLCDVCGAELGRCEVPEGEHLCTYCGERVTPCVDYDRDHICEICGEASTCADADGDHLCDGCFAPLTACADRNGDHLCDLCIARLTLCADENTDHLCDLCGGAVSACADLDKDGTCDLCGKDKGGCTDADLDHLCDDCGGVYSTCASADGDHICDLCGAKMTCLDLSGDHICDICGTLSFACTDADGDHICDLCGEVASEHTDAARDHLCDICGERVSACLDTDQNHLCDICGERDGDCADADGDHLCDGCLRTLSFCCDGGDSLCTLCGRLLASEGLRFARRADGTYKVIGIGDCTDTHLFIPKYYNGVAVTEIAPGAFAACRTLTFVSVPEGVKEIGLGAFAACTNLSALRIGDGVREIGLGAFFLCTSLRDAQIGSGTEELGLAAFADCMSLESVRIGTGLKKVMLGAFAGCVSLREVSLPEGLSVIGLGAFSGCGLESIYLPASVTRIGHGAFGGCDALENIYLGGTEENFASVSVADRNRPLLDASRFLYLEGTPEGQGRFWHYGEGGEILSVTLCPAHADENHNGACDFCHAFVGCTHSLDADGCCLWCSYFACPVHTDLDHDLLCDKCDCAVPCTDHADRDANGACDYCNAAFRCESHTDADGNRVCDLCRLALAGAEFPWESGAISFEMNNHSAEGTLSSRVQSFMAGEILQASKATAEAILARNAAAYHGTKLTVSYKYLPEFHNEYGWTKNYERIAVAQASGSYSDIYCNFATDLMAASLLGCFENLKTEREENYFAFTDPDYARTVGDGEGYMLSYMEALAFDKDRAYLLASDYFIDAVRAFYCVPVNASLLEALGAEDILGLGRKNTAEDLADAVAAGEWSYEVLLRYGATLADNEAYADTLGFAVAESDISASGLLYTSSVGLFADTPLGAEIPYTCEGDNEALYAFCAALGNLMRGKGVQSFGENGEEEVLMRFTGGKALFGGVTLLGRLEASAYANTDGGVLILPVPVYAAGVACETGVHEVARLGAISALSEKFSECSAFLSYQSTHSSEVLSSYFENDLLDGLCENEAQTALNLRLLSLMRERVGGDRAQMLESAISLFFPNETAITPNGEQPMCDLRWQDIFVAEHYENTYIESYHRMLRDRKQALARLIYLNGSTSLPR